MVGGFVGYVEVQNHNSAVGDSLFMFGSMMLSSGVLNFVLAVKAAFSSAILQDC